MKNTQEHILSLFSLFLPDETLEWFDIVSGEKDDKDMHLILEEKNIPPISEKQRGKTVKAKGFKDISVADFPVRGRKMTLTFKRRYWEVEGEEKLLKRDIRIRHEGTQLEKEFAAFLKEGG